MSEERRKSRAAPQSLSEEWAPLMNYFRGNGSKRKTASTAAGADVSSERDTSPSQSGSSTQYSRDTTLEKQADAVVPHPPGAHIGARKLSKHEQGMQGPNAAYAEEKVDSRTPSEIEQAVRVDTNDSLSAVRTISKVPGNNTYYEKGGLRTYGDGMDHVHEEPVSPATRTISS